MKTTAPSTGQSRQSPLSLACLWQAELAAAVRDPGELCRRLQLPSALAESAQAAVENFAILVPRPYLDRIQPGDPDDPLLLQVLPRKEETRPSPGFTTDPVGDAEACWGPGLLRKYRGRVLIVATGQCSVHCRFCFRRHFPYHSGDEQPPLSDGCLKRLAETPSLREVILSGGDPLTLPDALLAEFARNLANIPHLRRLRIHTRLPITVPQRVNEDLLGWLRGTRLAPLVVVHVNHPAEIDGAVADAVQALVDAGVPVLSQTVLLRGVNDRVDVLAALLERLVDLRVMPYYLHQLDPVAGAAHFEVPVAEGRRLIEELRQRLPGYAVPRYVRETPGGTSKQSLM